MNVYTSIPTADRSDSLERVADRVEASLDAQARLFAHRRYGSAIHGPDTELDGATERALVSEFSTLEAYWANPEPFETAKREGQARINAGFAQHDANTLKHMQDIWDKEAGQ